VALRLSNKDIVGLNAAMTVLLTPFAYEGDEWRRAVCAAFEAPLRAVGSSFALPLADEPLIGGVPDVVNALQALVPPPDWLVHGLMVKA
jgi:hypothetical protein